MHFQNREEAAYLLVKKLAKYQGTSPLILAIPRGAVPMGRILAEKLQGELDVVLVRKLAAPHNPELAIGAVDEQGKVYLNPDAKQFIISRSYLTYLEEERNQQLNTIRKRREIYTPKRNSIEVKDRIVIVVDDGIATGATMISALQLLRQKSPKLLVVATAVAPNDTIQNLRNFTNEIVCLHIPKDFYAVGQFFEDFEQVSDEEVINNLKPLKTDQNHLLL